MNNTEQSHISPDMLEAAARGHLPADQLDAVHAHCALCAACRGAYDEEIRIAHGTRSWARAALKQRLASRIAIKESAQVPWTRIFAAAAAILVLAGMGIMYQWLQVPPAAPDSSTTLTITTDSVTGQGLPSVELAESAKPAALPPPTIKQQAAAADEPRLAQKREQEEQISAPPVAAAPSNDATHMADESFVGSAVSAGGTHIMWGNIIPREGEAKEKAARSRAFAAEDPRIEARGAQMQGPGRTNVPAPVRYIVEQEAILPMYRRDASARPEQIPSRITRTGDTINIVLLLDTLFPDDVIRSATVLACPPDSLQVILRGTSFGFRTPPGFLP